MGGYITFTLLIVCLISVESLKLKKKTKEEKDGRCNKFGYCRGEAFPPRVQDIDSRTITCESEGVTEMYVKRHCCLPQQKHLVCYGVRVEGDRLNYSNDTANNLRSTDYTELCRYMVERSNKTPGRFNSATFVSGGGEVAFKSGVWVEVQKSDMSERHIHNIACAIED